MSQNPRRDELRAICRALPPRGEGETVNEQLAAHYAEQGYKVLKSYKQWQEEGRQVKKGETALLLWGKPNQHKEKQTADGQTVQVPTLQQDDDTKFFPLAYVFDITQTKPATDGTDN
ncbi:MAG: hypothetical protein JSS76_08480 [Bacteroidetes bacterium]|nr:hypothetical protein [Bacteroidota bacterium]